MTNGRDKDDASIETPDAIRPDGDDIDAIGDEIDEGEETDEGEDGEESE